MAFNPSQSCNAVLSTCATSEPMADVLRQLAAFGGNADQAGELSYTPTDPADWTNPDPTTVKQAIDRISAAVVGLLSGPIP
jgi:hypothetical protein